MLEKSSGIVRFENAALSPALLDTYCLYPFVIQGTTAPFDTFSNWNVRSLQGGAGPVTGRVSLTILITPSGNATLVNIRGNWVGGNPAEQHVLNSTLALEKELEQAVLNSMSAPEVGTKAAPKATPKAPPRRASPEARSERDQG